MTTPTLPSSDTSFSVLNESLIGEVDLNEDQYTNSLPHDVLQIREKFLLEWNSLIKLSQDVASDSSSTRRVTRSEILAKKKDISSGSQYFTGDARDKVVANLITYLTQIKADPLVFDPIVQEIKTAHSKEVDFRTKAFKLFKRELLFKQIYLENYAKSLETQVDNQKDRTAKEVDKVRGEFSRKLADALVENTRLTAEIDDSTRTNYFRQNLITDLEEKLKTQTGSDDKTLILTKTELESTKQEVEVHKNTISDVKKLIDKLKEDTKDTVAQLTHNYRLLSDEHESLKNACTTTDSEVITLTKANAQLTTQLNRIINVDLANLAILTDQNVQLTAQLTKLQQDVATKQVSVDSLRHTNQKLTNDIAALQLQLTLQPVQVAPPTTMTPAPPSPPPPPPTPPPAIPTPTNLQQQIQAIRGGLRAATPNPDDVPVTKSHLRELYSQDERKSIPVFKGKRGEQLINNWLKDAERVAQSAGWTPKDKIKYFSDRLRGDAADWHSDYMDRATNKDDYDAWEKALINRSLTESEVENLRKQLNELRQGPDQSTQTFVSRLNHLYDIIHGKEIVIDEMIAPPEAIELARSLRKIRGEAKQKILLKGILPAIKKVVWARIGVDSSYEDVCEITYEAETIVNRMEQNEDKSLQATIAGISAHEDEQDVELLRQKTKLSKLEKQMAVLKINPTTPQETPEVALPTVAITEAYNRHRSPSGDRRRPNSESRIRFQQPPPRPSQDNSYSRDRGRDNSYYRSRSPGDNRYHQTVDSQSRRDQTPPRPNFSNNQPDRNNFQRTNSDSFRRRFPENTPYPRPRQFQDRTPNNFQYR
ncbi:hypothetical protein DAPPUDRAFT_114860 [Daphnia pulex]|uniref:Retrotransposon gag domain-containing protein n=1 Tax=Daphnia pulex TaxID=6669 RepID=E9HJI2_DAPPU|nr:hypothetical protein DAPPUDRAFT_114860 [Daphnia pulex]|eukprot:EFX68095.1 hypothetical protein DAPPUDRAFT_114860 [Daphnia pulex]